MNTKSTFARTTTIPKNFSLKEKVKMIHHIISNKIEAQRSKGTEHNLHCILTRHGKSQKQ
jgi:hypothetical protein